MTEINTDDSKKFEILTYAILQRLTDELADGSVGVNIVRNYVTKNVHVTIRVRILAEEAGIYKHPDGWWQAFKEQHFPYWLKEKFPVKFKSVTFKCLYPYWKPSLPHEINNVIPFEDNIE